MSVGSEICRMRRRLPLVVFSVLFAVVAMLALSHPASAALGPLTVRGYIRDNAGHPLEGASVTVNIRYASDQSLRSTLSDDSDSVGFYSVTFGNSQWDAGNIIEVIATWHGNQEDNTRVASSAAVQYVNVTYAFEIGEFGSGVLGLAIAGGAIGAVAVAIMVIKRRS